MDARSVDGCESSPASKAMKVCVRSDMLQLIQRGHLVLRGSDVTPGRGQHPGLATSLCLGGCVRGRATISSSGVAGGVGKGWAVSIGARVEANTHSRITSEVSGCPGAVDAGESNGNVPLFAGVGRGALILGWCLSARARPRCYEVPRQMSTFPTIGNSPQ